MTHWGLYGEPGFPPLSVFAEGLRGAGLPFAWRNHNHWSGETERFDAVAIFGFRAQGRDIVEHYLRQGVPVVVLDFGYMKRVNTPADYDAGYFQVGIGKLGWMPDAAPGDRYAELGLEPRARENRRPIRRVLICGQVPFDAQHRMTADELTQTYERLAAQLYRAGARKILFRPHPLGAGVRPDIELAAMGTLEDALLQTDLVVSLNSNAGLEAIIAGCPAVNVLPSHYDALSHRWPVMLGAIEAPPPARVAEHLKRLAYAQWTAAEIREGLAHRFLQSIGAIP